MYFFVTQEEVIKLRLEKIKVETDLEVGDKVEIVEKTSNGWYKIKYKNVTGYVSSKYVTIGNGNGNSKDIQYMNLMFLKMV